jgi:ATP-dependent Lon protease
MSRPSDTPDLSGDPSMTGPAVEEPPGETATESPSPRGPAPGQRPPIPDQLPILPMREVVGFPGTIVPLGVQRDKSKRVIEHAIGSNKLIGVVTQRNPETEDPGLDDLYRVGTVCIILRLIRMPDETMSIIVHGLTRMGIAEMVSDDPFLTARIELHDDSTERTPEIDALVDNARQAATRAIELSPNIPDEAQVVLNNIETPGGVADFLAANLPAGTAERQELLETLDVTARLRKINTLLAQQVEVLELSNKIQSQVRDQMNEQQREYFLQQQLKAIQKELGETDARQAEIEQLRERLDQASLPEEARK